MIEEGTKKMSLQKETEKALKGIIPAVITPMRKMGLFMRHSLKNR